MFLREERKLTPEEADLLRGQVETRRAELRYTSGCNSGCALFALAFGALLVSRLTVPDHWNLSEVGSAFLKIAGALACLWTTAYMIKDFLKTQRDGRRFERDEVLPFEAALKSGDGVVYTVNTEDVVLVSDPYDDLVATMVPVDSKRTLCILWEVEARDGDWPAAEFTVIQALAYPKWFVVTSSDRAPDRVRRIELVSLPEDFFGDNAPVVRFEPGTPEEVLRRLDYNGPIDLLN